VVAIIGVGKMAEAIVEGLFKDAFPYQVKLNVYDTNMSRMKIFNEKFGATIHTDMKACVTDADLTLLACKPQNVEEVGKTLSGVVENQLFLSILAGSTLEQLQAATGARRIVRSMPNIPASVQEGCTVWTAAKSVSAEEKELCSRVLSAFGEEHFVEDEKYLDMATAISGSGPAYVLLMIEAMIETGVHFGFPRALATKLVHQTVRGASVMAMSTDMNESNMRANITSPGGTTAAALYSLESGGFRTVVADALWSAYRRSLELGNQDSKVGPGRFKTRK
jgi:pyrroline-5-carboxylate reductase